MAVVIIDELTDIDDVVQLMDYFTRTLASGDVHHLLAEGTFTLTRGPEPTPNQVADLVRMNDDETICLDRDHREGCSCRADAAATDPRQGLVVDPDRHDGPVPYLPCPERGQHSWLADCWMCWSDVHRGAASLDEVLTPEGVTA